MELLKLSPNEVLEAIERHAFELYQAGVGAWSACRAAAIEAAQIQMDIYLVAPCPA